MIGTLNPIALLSGAASPMAAAAGDALAAAGYRVLRADGGTDAFAGAPVTCLVTAASSLSRDTALDASRAGLDAHFSANVVEPALLAAHFAKALPDRKTGLVIHIADQHLSAPAPMPFAATLSQDALWSLTRLLAQALAPRIRVNLIAPGPVLAALRSAPMKKDVMAQRVGEAVRYLLQAEAVTGQMLALDLSDQ